MTSINYYKQLCETNIEETANLLSSNTLENVDLIFLLEIFGETILTTNENYIKLLISFLNHNSTIVREAAVYGLSNHIQSKIVHDALFSALDNEMDPYIIDSIQYSLDTINFQRNIK